MNSFETRAGDWAGAAVLLALAFTFSLTDMDRRIALAWAFDAQSGSFPARNAFWATTLLHSGGRALVWMLAMIPITGLMLGLAPRRFPEAAMARQRLLVAMLGLGLTSLLIGALKHVTHMDCPWDLRGLGGNVPYIALFEARPGGLPVAACFPAAHAGSGFGLLSFWFAWRDTKFGRVLLVLALLTGSVFGLGQQARGAHFLSHDVWSLAIAWTTCACVCAAFEAGRLISSRAASHEYARRVVTSREQPSATVVEAAIPHA